MSTAPAQIHRHGFVRGHLVESHGYDSRYVETSTVTTLLNEHGRLHEDETAKNLDHDHA